MSAIISDCGQYRYLLTRPSEVEHPERSTALFLMLNPSTADASLDDPTIRRCRGFARSWGCAGLAVANLYALRATNPKELWKHDAPIGDQNNAWLAKLAKEHCDIICAWGANAKPGRVKEVSRILVDAGARLWCMGTTKSGAPKHPLYIKADQPLVAWEAV
ncbi:DUF1643 domain-containing protein [Halomonas janggokensis]|uniref:DUF1643 domain-containing protein n=1 Tax=Vreelandella janggokensis TaxID=370767 RepID=A0ABT4IS35_9GAMM|nr:DUF1643 domain-containing protein [Halomonas janggokensis]MCZ0926475.1 DUF1643 domain-containing protein [Halomonas janggokensis]MCZ0929013.1 DUF1643 domain-containing protein [Halomonas janggokensis]